MLKNKSKSTGSVQHDSESEALLKSFASNASLSSASNDSSSKTNDYISFRRRAKIKQQERYGRIRLVLLVLGILFIIFLSFVTNSRQYQPQISVIIPSDDLNLPGPTGKFSI